MTERLCIVGPDGAGKSSLASRVRESWEHAGHPVELVRVWDALVPEGSSKEALARARKELACQLPRLSPRERFELTLEGWRQACARCDPAALWVVDGFWYKYAASEMAHGLPRSEVEECLHSIEGLVASPRLVYLEVGAQTAAGRKEHFTDYECGYQEVGEVAFVEFQTRARAFLEDLLRPLDPLWIDGRQPLETLLRHIPRPRLHGEGRHEKWLGSGESAW